LETPHKGTGVAVADFHGASPSGVYALHRSANARALASICLFSSMLAENRATTSRLVPAHKGHIRLGLYADPSCREWAQFLQDFMMLSFGCASYDMKRGFSLRDNYLTTCFHVLSLYYNTRSLVCQAVTSWCDRVFYSIIPKSSVSGE
jgi:hypothetical protein